MDDLSFERGVAREHMRRQTGRCKDEREIRAGARCYRTFLSVSVGSAGLCVQSPRDVNSRE